MSGPTRSGTVIDMQQSAKQQQIQDLMRHPGWPVFLEALKGEIRKAQKTMETRNFYTPDQLEEAMIAKGRLLYLKGVLRAAGDDPVLFAAHLAEMISFDS